MAIQVASMFGVLDLKDNMSSGLDTAKTNMTSFGDKIKNVGDSLTNFGQKMTLAMAPVALALGASVKSFIDFEEAMTNVGAVMGLSKDGIDAYSQAILDIGESARAGPQAVAEAFYDIVGGVADASTHMAILNAAIQTSEAGNANLAGTTKALISVMNSYGFAEDASMVSDVLTQTVAKGVGTMDEFAGALPTVSGLAASLGIDFSDLGAMMAYLTTKGNSASEAATQLGAMMTAILKPNEKMKDALSELGFASGEAAIEQLGLLGAMDALSTTNTVANEGMAAVVGTTEALRGVTSFASDDVDTFFTTFTDGVDGATEAARNIQMQSSAAQFDLLKSSVQGLGIEIGAALTPTLTDLAMNLRPVIMGITEWITKNPQAATTIALVAAGLVVLGPILTVVGYAISAVGTVVGLLSGAFGIVSGVIGIVAGALAALLTGPVLLIGAAIAVLVGLLGMGEGGFAGALDRVHTGLVGLAGILQLGLTRAAQAFKAIVQGVIDIVTALVNKLQEALGLQQQVISNKSALSTEQLNAGINPLTAQALTLFTPTPDMMPSTPTGGASEFSGMGNLGAALYGNFASGGDANGPAIGHAMGGDVNAGQQYLVGERGPELFTPGAVGSITPNSAMGGVQIGQVVIHANSASEGRAAADGFERRLKELRLSRGLT